MKIVFSKQFEKQISKLRNPDLEEGIGKAILEIKQANSLQEIPNIKKMKNHDSAYRKRVGNYRIGFFYEDGEVFVVTVLHRKDIYKTFP